MRSCIHLYTGASAAGTRASVAHRRCPPYSRLHERADEVDHEDVAGSRPDMFRVACPRRSDHRGPARPPARATDESAARLFAAHALALRSAVVAGEERAAEVLAAMPGAGMVARGTLPALWGPSFANAIVKLGRLRSSGPAALYYDPLLDIAVLTLWTRADEGYRVVSVRALVWNT